MPTPLRVLILEDRPEDAELMVLELKRAGFDPDWTRVDTKEDYLANLDLYLDVILSDFVVPQFDGLTALKLLQEKGLNIPFIVVTGSFEELAIACVRQGAADYVIKEKLGRLGEAVAQALGEKRLREEKLRVEQAMHESEGLYRTLFDESKDAIIITNRYGRIIELNPAAEDLFGYDLDETLELLERDLHTDPDKADALLEEIKKHGSVQGFPVQLRSKSGREMDCLATWTIRVGADGGFLGRRGFVRDVSDRKRLEQALQVSEARFRTIADNAFDAIVLADEQGRISYWNPAASRMFGYVPDESVGKPLTVLFEDELGAVGSGNAAGQPDTEDRHVLHKQLTARKKTGEPFPTSVAIATTQTAGGRTFSLIVRDLEEAERVRQALELRERLKGLRAGDQSGA